MADDIEAMLIELQSRPSDVALRARTAEALSARGKHDDAAAVLQPLVNLTGHDDDAQLPCLCKKCLPVAARTAEAAGMQFERSFAIVRDRVLHFWIVSELVGDAVAVRGSVQTALEQRLKRRAR